MPPGCCLRRQASIARTMSSTTISTPRGARSAPEIAARKETAKETGMHQWSRKKPRGELPRVVTPNLLWTGGCLSIEYQGELAHGHFSTYLVLGSEKSM